MIKKKKIRINVFSYNSKILQFLMTSINKEFESKFFMGPFYLPKKRKVFCVLRSPFVNKNSRDIYELQLHQGFFVCNFTDFINTLKYLRLLFKKFSFEFSNNIFISLQSI